MFKALLLLLGFEVCLSILFDVIAALVAFFYTLARGSSTPARQEHYTML